MKENKKKDEFEVYSGMLKNEDELEEELDEIGKDTNQIVEKYFTDPEEERAEIDLDEE